MKYVLLLSLSISFIISYSCGDNKHLGYISSIDKDFPNSEQLEFSLLNEYDILSGGVCHIDEPILWYMEDPSSHETCGRCYDMNTGELISTIANIGRSSVEFTTQPLLRLSGDSAYFYLQFAPYSIKTFSKMDILENKPMNERKVNIVTPPDSLSVGQMVKLPNGNILATIIPCFRLGNLEINSKSIATFNHDFIRTYETINYNSFAGTNKTNKKNEFGCSLKDKIKACYAQGEMEVRDSTLAVFSVCKQFILYTFNIESGTVRNEKRYTSIEDDGHPNTFSTKNSMNLSVCSIKNNDKYIFCIVTGYFSAEDKNSENIKTALFVFDWNLNPIKRFDLPQGLNKNSYAISNSFNAIYCWKYTDERLALYKAGLRL